MLDFIQSADFGGIKLGMTRHQIQHLLGDPPNWSVTRRRKRLEIATIWRYGSIEFYFADHTDLLDMIFSDHFPLEGSPTLTLDPWILRESLLLDDTLPLLDQANLRYQLTTDTRLGMTNLIFESGVALSYNPPTHRPPYEDGPLELTSFYLRQSTGVPLQRGSS